MLEQKAAAGVQVCAIFDGFANLVVVTAVSASPRRCRRSQYHSLSRVWYALDPRRYARDHRKLLVVDQQIAFIGSFNIGKLYATEWRGTTCASAAQPCRISPPASPFLEQQPRAAPADRSAAGAPVARPDQRSTGNDPARLLFPIRGMYLDAINQRPPPHLPDQRLFHPRPRGAL